MLKSSNDFYDINNTSLEYLSFLKENIDWFTAEQSKSISTELNNLRDYANSKIDSIDNARVVKKEQEKRVEEEKQKAEKDAKEKEKRDKEIAWMKRNWHVGKWELRVENLKLILDLKQNGNCNVYFINRWINDLSYEKKSNKIYISTINDVNLEFKWKIPFYYLNDTPFCYLNPSKKKGYVDVAFWVSAHLTKYNEYLVSENRKVVKSLRYYQLEDINEHILLDLIIEDDKSIDAVKDEAYTGIIKLS